MLCKADDAGGLSPGKEENAAQCKKDCKGTAVFKWFHCKVSVARQDLYRGIEKRKKSIGMTKICHSNGFREFI